MMRRIAGRIAVAAVGFAAAGVAAATEVVVAPAIVVNPDSAPHSLPWIAVAAIVLLLGVVALAIRRVPAFARY